MRGIELLGYIWSSMKNTFKLLLGFCFWVFVANAQPPGEWMWIHGDSTVNYSGNFGVQGVPSPLNVPPSLYEAFEWKDSNGNFWLFGGILATNGKSTALWKYEPSINQWTWMKGPSTPNAPGHYGVQGVPDTANYPGSRGWGGVTWTDLQGNLWLYGGSNEPLFRYADLWRYSIATNTWTWMKGDTTWNAPPVYGLLGVPDSANSPGGRDEIATGWIDAAGDLWVFGGRLYFGMAMVRNDLWRYNIASDMWTWMKGSQLNNDPGFYGIKGIETTANLPPSRLTYSHWVDLDGNFWLFGGGDRTPNNYYNDLWRYKPSTNNWTWMSGDSVPNNLGTYGVKCVASPANVPSARFENRATVTDENGNFWMFGGYNYSIYNGDLWMYCVSSNEWTWKSGDTGSVVSYYGALNTPNPLNQPAGRFGANAFFDNSGHIYLFGGFTYGNLKRNDLWRFTIGEACGSYCDPIPTNIFSSEKTKSEIKIYPNPTTNILTLETNSTNLLSSITIYSTDGRKVREEILSSKEEKVELNLSGLAGGIYFLDCVGEKGKQMVRVVKY
jgi:hypothetical protein